MSPSQHEHDPFYQYVTGKGPETVVNKVITASSRGLPISLTLSSGRKCPFIPTEERLSPTIHTFDDPYTMRRKERSQ